MFINGGRTGIIENPEDIYEDIPLINPIFLDGTPRFFDVVYNQFKKALAVAYAQKKIEKGDELTESEEIKIRSEVRFP